MAGGLTNSTVARHLVIKVPAMLAATAALSVETPCFADREGVVGEKKRLMIVGGW